MFEKRECEREDPARKRGDVQETAHLAFAYIQYAVEILNKSCL